MNFRPTPALAIVALVLAAAAPHSQAASNFTTFRTQLSLRVKPNSGMAGARVASALLGRYARLSPGESPKFASLARAFVRRAISRGQLGPAMAALIRGLSVNFFKGTEYNPSNPAFVRALNILLGAIPPSQLTLPVRSQIANQLVMVNAVNGGSAADAQALVKIVESAGGGEPVS